MSGGGAERLRATPGGGLRGPRAAPGGAARALLSAALPGGRRARLSILIYHQVLPGPDPLRPDELDAATFEWHARLLADAFNVLDLGEAIERLRRRSLPPRAACITFDDGYADNAEVAWPILRALGLPVTIFVATGYLDGGCMFNDAVIEAVRAAPAQADLSGLGLGVRRLATTDERRALVADALSRAKHLEPARREQWVAALAERLGGRPPRLMMTTTQVRALAAQGVAFGGHTVAHPILAAVDLERARDEIASGRECLAGIAGRPVRLFAYPNGRPGRDFGPEHVRLVRDLGFAGAVTTSPGSARPDTDPFLLPRFTPWDRSPGRFLVRMALNARQPGPARDGD